MQYRPEIDGLRALAVVPVILFHAGFTFIGGGFLGVDIFFVISGFLITSILLRELNDGRFSILKFYERRARRILPALFFIVACCVPFAVIWLQPDQLKEFYHSIIAVMLFSSNILFWSESGYFESASEEKPLLHTWSLAVEEQFYIAFPLLLMFLWRFGKNPIFYCLLGISLFSLLLSEVGWRKDVTANYYFAITRAWELLAGSMAAMYMQSAKKPNPNNILSLIGLGLVVFSMFAYTKHTNTPSLYTLVPILGTVAIILYGRQGTWVYKLLANPVCVGIGMISYSAYLWHQPLFAFARIRSIYPPEWPLMLGLSFASLILAYLSWKFVETPFRRNGERFYKKKNFILASSVIGLFAFIGVGAVGSMTTEPGAKLSRETTYGQCNFDQKNCYFSGENPTTVAVWGDSYADAFSLSLGELLNGNGIDLALFIKHACPSIVGVMRNEPNRLGIGFQDECRAYSERSLAEIIKLKPDFLVLTSSYEAYLNNTNSRGEPVLIRELPEEGSNLSNLAEQFAQTVATVLDHGIQVIFVSPHAKVPQFSSEKKKLYFTDQTQIYADWQSASDSRQHLITALENRDLHVHEINGLNWYCNEHKRCPVVLGDGQLALYDGKHVSSVISKKIAADILGVVQNSGLQNNRE